MSLLAVGDVNKIRYKHVFKRMVIDVLVNECTYQYLNACVNVKSLFYACEFHPQIRKTFV